MTLGLLYMIWSTLSDLSMSGEWSMSNDDWAPYLSSELVEFDWFIPFIVLVLAALTTGALLWPRF